MYFTACIAVLLAVYSAITIYSPSQDASLRILSAILWIATGLPAAFLPLYFVHALRGRLWTLQPGEYLLLAGIVNSGKNFALVAESLWGNNIEPYHAYYAIELCGRLCLALVFAAGTARCRDSMVWRFVLGLAFVLTVGDCLEVLLYWTSLGNLVPLGPAMILIWLKLLLRLVAPLLGLIAMIWDLRKGVRRNSWHWLGCLAMAFVFARSLPWSFLL